MPGAYTDQLLTEIVYQDGAAVAKVGGALGGGVNFTAPLTATPNGATSNVDIGVTGAGVVNPSMIGTGAVIGPGDSPPLPLWVNRTGSAQTFAGADLWPGDDNAHDGTNYMTITLLVYATTSLAASPGPTGILAQWKTDAVDWVAGVPVAGTGSTTLTVPAGGVLGWNSTHTGTGQGPLPLAIWLR